MVTKIGSNAIVDLFCGCGGFGLGAELAGFEVITAIDCEPILQSAYRFNMPKTDCRIANLAEVSASFWQEALGRAKKTWWRSSKFRVAGVVGGPPCQGFSAMGRREKNDSRNLLVAHFFRHVMLIKPKFFVMENVVGLCEQKNHKLLQEALEPVRKNYQIVEPVILNAADFGAATNRRRVFVIGYDSSEVETIDIEQFKKSYMVKKKSSVHEAIYDLPSPSYGEKDAQHGFSWHPLKQNSKANGLSTYATRARGYPARAGLGWNFARKQQQKGLISGLLPTEHEANVEARFAKIACGKIDKISKFPRLRWDGLCPVLRAGTGKDRSGHQAARPIHPQQARVISVREAARLQGFPDWFVFHPAKWHSFRMIGNSVSPLMARALFTFLKRMVDE